MDAMRSAEEEAFADESKFASAARTDNEK